MLLKHVLLYLSTDRYPNPSNIMMAYDAGIAEVIPYAKITPDIAKDIVQSAMFARGVDSCRYTLVFIDGSDLDLIDSVVDAVKVAMFPPFTHSIIIDPKGSYTLSASTIAKIEDTLRDFNEKFEGKNVLVLGGTGTRGRIISKLCAEKKANVTVASQDRLTAITVAAQLSKQTKTEVNSAEICSSKDTLELAKNAEVIISCGPQGKQFLPKDALEFLPKCRVIVDLNAVPPSGVGGVKPEDNKVKIGNITSIGLFPLEDLRSVVLNKLFKRAILAEGGGLFDYREGYEIAKTLLHVEA